MAVIGGNVDLRETFDGTLSGIAWVPASVVGIGDPVVWDSTLNSGNGAARRPRNDTTPHADADLASYLGICRQVNPVQSLGDQINNIDIRKQGSIRVLGTSGETYTMFQAVYFNDVQALADGIFRRVTNVATGRTHIVGYVLLSQEFVMGGVLNILAAAQTEIEIVVTPNFPAVAY
jgi:hypothetical protein